MGNSHHFMIMSLKQAKENYRNLVTIYYLTYFPISQIVSGKGSLYEVENTSQFSDTPTQKRVFNNI